MAHSPCPTLKYHTDLQQSTAPTRPELSVQGKTVLLTGGGTGIGAKTAQFFAQAGAARIALLGRRLQPLLDTKKLINAECPNVDVFVASCDVTKKDELDAAFARYLGETKLDILVSSAAIVGTQESLDNLQPEVFLQDLQVGLSGAVLTAQAFSRYASSNAVAIEVNSSAAHLNYVARFVSYSVSKLAVYRIWDALAFAHPEWRVYHVQPGVIDTDMNREAGGVKAVGHADDVSLPAGFILWLTSPEAEFLKGKFLWANWDVDELKARAKEIGESRMFNIDLVGWPFGESNNWKFEAVKGSTWAE